MFRRIKQMATVATVTMVAGTPALASAAQITLPPQGQPVSAGQIHSAPVSAETSASSQPLASSSSQGFQWGDAAIGAAGVVGLASICSGAAVAARRRRLVND